jgi:hypothetical protein
MKLHSAFGNMLEMYNSGASIGLIADTFFVDERYILEQLTCSESIKYRNTLKETIMIQSNTKLCSTEKDILREYKAERPNIKFVNDGVTTFAYQYMGNTVRFATSVMSPNEKKFRRKVGEYLALMNMVDNDRFVHMKPADFVIMLETFDIYIAGVPGYLD